MRVNPILDWSYRDIWAFILTCKIQYCSLYDQGYTSIGSIHNTLPNSLLCISDSSEKKENFKPAYLLPDGRLERAGRVKKFPPLINNHSNAMNNGPKSLDLQNNCTFTASIIAVGDEILFGTVQDGFGSLLLSKLKSIGWSISHTAVLRNDIDSVAEEVEFRRSNNDMVFIYGEVGPLHSDVTLGGVAKAFGVRLTSDEEFGEYLRHFGGDQWTGDHNEIAQLPEGVTKLLNHENLSLPLIKCRNVIIFSATNVEEFPQQWDCLMTRTRSNGMLRITDPYVTQQLTTNMSDVEMARTLSKLCHEFPDVSIGCYREFRQGPIVISFTSRDEA